MKITKEGDDFTGGLFDKINEKRYDLKLKITTPTIMEEEFKTRLHFSWDLFTLFYFVLGKNAITFAKTSSKTIFLVFTIRYKDEQGILSTYYVPLTPSLFLPLQEFQMPKII